MKLIINKFFRFFFVFVFVFEQWIINVFNKFVIKNALLFWTLYAIEWKNVIWNLHCIYAIWNYWKIQKNHLCFLRRFVARFSSNFRIKFDVWSNSFFESHWLYFEFQFNYLILYQTFFYRFFLSNFFLIFYCLLSSMNFEIWNIVFVFLSSIWWWYFFNNDTWNVLWIR